MIEVKEITLFGGALELLTSKEKKKIFSKKQVEKSSRLPPVIVSISQPWHSFPKEFQNIISNRSQSTPCDSSESFLFKETSYKRLSQRG